MSNKILLALAYFSLFLVSAPAIAWQSSEASPDPSVLKRNVESFELVWKTIKETHWDESLVGEAWSRKRVELLPRIEAAKTIEQGRSVMTELIESLGQSHFGVIPASSYEAIEGVRGGAQDIGLTVRLIENQLLVTKVREASSAAVAGVKTGWQLTQVRGKRADELIQRFREAEQGPQRAETIAGLTMARMLSGSEGQSLKIEFLDERDRPVTLEIPCQPAPGRRSQFGNLPPIRVDDETRTYPGNIGYYRFSAFLDPMRIMPAWRKAVGNPQHAKGFIIDLRGNIGGLAGMTMGMTNAFVSEQVSLGTMTMKGNRLNFVAHRAIQPYTGPVAVLVDECSISSAEILAGGLQDLKLARIFGTRTAGLAYPSTVIKLPNGDGLQYAIADYHSASGKRLEKTGVVPDEEIRLSKSLLAAQSDPVLDAAISWIESKNRQ